MLLPQTVLDLFTIALLLFPYESFPRANTYASHPPVILWDSLKRVARQLELVGPHENWAADYGSEINYCRSALKEVLNEPGLYTAVPFPSLTDAKHYAAFWIARKDFLTARKGLYYSNFTMIDQLDQQWSFACLNQSTWELLMEVKQPERSWLGKRRALARLKQTLGYEWFYSGTMPLWFD